ncbi:hypothetical protein J6590_031038 [Homalodisca vitripennis]|nr:hypothetical protein J6590_031038 [Homalodisca vitripennis]
MFYTDKLNSYFMIVFEQRSLELESDVRLLAQLAGEASSSLDTAQNDLMTATDELAQLYHLVCTVNGETPTRVLLDHEKHTDPKSEGDKEGVQLLRARLKSDLANKELESLQDAAAMARHVETVLDQIRHLHKAVHHTIERAKGQGSNTDVRPGLIPRNVALVESLLRDEDSTMKIPPSLDTVFGSLTNVATKLLLAR